MATRRLLTTAFEREVNRYRNAGKPYFINTRPYYSTGAYRFRNLTALLPGGIEAPAGGGVGRILLKADAGQVIQFFAYAINDDMTAQGVARTSTSVDTNIQERTNTNNENLVVDGLSATCRGTCPVFATALVPGDADFQAALSTGATTIEDISAQVTPPEACSPLALEDALFRAIGPKVELFAQWNRRNTEYIGTLDQLAEGGGKSQLRSNGDPNVMDYFRVPEGWIWRKEGDPQDTSLVVTAELQEDVLVFASYPIAWITTDPAAGVNNTPTITSLTDIFLQWKLRLHGKAFYYPSRNT